MAKEAVIPKMYIYTVEGVLDENENPKKFSIPSLSRELDNEFDLECISNSAALFFYLDSPEYQDESKWPLLFKFQSVSGPVELEMNLSYSPCFLSTPRKIIKEKKVASSPVEIEKKTRKPRAKKETVKDTSVIDKEVNDFISDYQDYLVLVPEPEVKPNYGACVKSLSDIDDLLTSIKSVSEEEVEYVKIKYKEVYYFLKVHPEFYNVLNPILVFDPIIAEEGELIEVPLKETTE